MKWISTKERQPEKKSQQYLVTTKVGKSAPTVGTLWWSNHYDYNTDEYRWAWTYWSSYSDCEEAYDDSEVLAWMPLPEPFEES